MKEKGVNCAREIRERGFILVAKDLEERCDLAMRNEKEMSMHMGRKL